MIGFIRNKPLPARRYLVLLVLPSCLMLLLTVAVLWPCLANFRTTVKTLRDVRLPAILEAQRTRTNLSMLRKHLVIIYLAEAPLERRRARLHAQALLAGMQESQKTLAQALAGTVTGYATCIETARDICLHRGKVHYALLPVWLLNTKWEGKDFLFAVNGQTGKVVADLPISVGKFLLGSLIAAIPVYILLCLLTVLTPGMTLTIVGVLAIIANICYSQELTMIAVKEAGTEDKGRIAKEQPEALGAINNRRRLKAAKKATKTIKKKTNTSFIAYFILFIFVIQFVPALFAIIAGIGGSFDNADGSLILFVILTIISFIFSIRAFSSFDRMPGHKGVAGLIFGMVSMLIGDAVLLFQPVLDAWYYGAAFIIIASVLITLINVIRAFNVLTTRKLPQFATHKGGDDRA